MKETFDDTLQSRTNLLTTHIRHILNALEDAVATDDPKESSCLEMVLQMQDLTDEWLTWLNWFHKD